MKSNVEGQIKYRIQDDEIITGAAIFETAE
jgi:hypothetical protein